MQINQGFVPGWNQIYSSLSKKVAHVIITANLYTSEFSAMVQNMEVGNYVEDTHINPGAVLLQRTIINSDIFTDYYDDLATAVYSTNIDLVFPSTYQENVVRQSFSLMQNVSELITALTANIRTSLEYRRNELVKQLLYNYWQYGLISCEAVDYDPAVPESSANVAIKINTIVKDFRTELNPRYTPYNNQIAVQNGELGERLTVLSDLPYIITFNDIVTSVKFLEAERLTVGTFVDGEDNQEFLRRNIRLNRLDFPTEIPPTGRSTVTGDNVSAVDINFFEMPTDENGNDLFQGSPFIDGLLTAFVLDPLAIKLFTHWSIMTAWLNPATGRHTNREIYEGIMELGAFNKIVAIIAEGVSPLSFAEIKEANAAHDELMANQDREAASEFTSVMKDFAVMMSEMMAEFKKEPEKAKKEKEPTT
jgi:hypothetical protein